MVHALIVLQKYITLKSIIIAALIAFLATAASLIAQPEKATFPTLRRTYDVEFSENARKQNGQIKVIHKGEGSWIYAEYTFKVRPGPRIAPPGGPLPPAEEPKTLTKKMWLNTQWIVSASESEGDKK